MKRMMLGLLLAVTLLLAACEQADPVEQQPETDDYSAEEGRAALEQKQALELELQSREADLERQEAQMEERERALTEREEAVFARESDVESREEALSKAEASLQSKENGLDEREAQLSATQESGEQALLYDFEGTDAWQQWLADLQQSDLFGGLYMANDAYHVGVVDTAAFMQTDLYRTMTTFDAQFTLVPVKYSYKQLVAAMDRLLDKFTSFQITATWIDAERNAVGVGTMDVSEKNQQAIKERCGIDNVSINYESSYEVPE